MSRFTILTLIMLSAILCSLGTIAAGATDLAKPALGSPFTDNMVLQRDMPVPIWGWTTPGAKVSVSISGKTATATADATGKWLVKLGPFAAGGPFELTVRDQQKVTTLRNVLIGDVWICSGQSNMEMGIANAMNAEEEMANANNAQIRLFTVARNIAMLPRDTVSGGQWDVCTPETIRQGVWGGFSATAYYFGRRLQQELHVPIGLIHTSWSGMTIEPFTSIKALSTVKGYPDLATAAVNFEKSAIALQQGGESLDTLMEKWYGANDPGTINGWASLDYIDKDWKSIELPIAMEESEGTGLGKKDLDRDYNGVVWFRHAFDLPANMVDKDLELHLGRVDDFDTTYVNGVRVGATMLWSDLRVYRIPRTLLKAGRNVIAVRCYDTWYAGGMTGGDDMRIVDPTDPNVPPIPLNVAWNIQASVETTDKVPAFPRKLDDDPTNFSVLYNGMIAPLTPMAMKGAIWYQGESNAGRAYQYRTLLPLMINDWRARFSGGNFPFLVVQLANFMGAAEYQDSDWAELREAQFLAMKHDAKVGMAVTIDIGDANDIHPKNKQEVGNRLALNALALAYGRKIAYSGPIYERMRVEGDAIRLYFSHTEKGLLAKGDALTGFVIAGADRHFVKADARIDGDTVVVSSTIVKNPLAVRYAWATNPICNLYNGIPLPASPFRTDDWPGVTTQNK